ncbi:hypothetical protein JOM56_004504 [Amanita muscaria]
MSPQTATVPMVAIQPDAVACSVQTLLYGVYVVSFFHCLRWLVFDPEGRKFRHWPMTIVTVALFVLMTLNVAAMFRLMLLALEGDSGSPAYSTTYIVSAGIGVTILLIVDGVLIYRCWIIYRDHDSWLIIIIPLSFLWIADLVSAIVGIILLALNHGWPSAQQQNSRYSYGLNIVYTTFFSCEIAINVYATSAIALRIIRVTKWDGRRNSGRLYKIGLILVESGVLFTITCVLSLCLKVLATGMGNLTSFIMNAINLNTAGITFNLILIRVGKERLQPSDASQDASKTTALLTTVQFSASTQTSESEPRNDNVALC